MQTRGFQLGPWYVDLIQHVLRDDTLVVTLSENEARILAWMFARGAEPVPRAELQTEVLGYAETVESRALDASLLRLRRKLESHPTGPRPLQTLRGLGVQLVGARAASERPTTSLETPPGRQDLVEDLGALLEMPGIITLQGASGIGKTAIARYVCERNRGVWVDCVTLTTEDGLRAAVARGTGIAPDALDQRGAGQPLLILDNFEQLPPAAAVSVETWARQSAVLVTSIRPLRVAGERVVPVPPLDRDVARRVLEDQIDRVGMQARPQQIERLLDTVGGHPLALLLLAPVTRDLDGLTDEDLLTLESDRPGDPDRHHSLRAAVGRALGFVSGDAATLLAQAAQFSERFRLDALAAVAGRPAGGVLPLVRELVRFGLLQTELDTYSLLPVVRMHAHREDPSARARLRDYLLAIRELELREGAPALQPYRADLLGILDEVDDDRWMDVLFAAEVAGATPHELLSAVERRSPNPFSNGDVLGLWSYVFRVTGEQGPRVQEVIDALRTCADPTPLSLFEKANTGAPVSLAEIVAVQPDRIDARWVNIASSLVSRLASAEGDALLDALRVQCEHRGWWFGAEIAAGALARSRFVQGDVEGAYRRLRDLPFSTMYPYLTVLFQVSAWSIGARQHARELNGRAIGLAARTPHHLLALRAIAAVFAHLDGDPAAAAMAEEALATRFGGTGLGMATLARMVLVLHGRAESTGAPAMDAALKGAPIEGSGLFVVLARWLADSSEPASTQG